MGQEPFTESLTLMALVYCQPSQEDRGERVLRLEPTLHLRWDLWHCD